MNPYMQMAVETAIDRMNRGVGGPFGVIIVKNSEVISVVCNAVLAPAHAEITALGTCEN